MNKPKEGLLHSVEVLKMMPSEVTNPMYTHSREIILRDWRFNKIDIKDKEIYARFIQETQYPTNLWSSNFDYLWAVSNPHSELVLWKVIDDMLITFKLSKKRVLQIPFLPFGRGNADKVTEVLLKCLQFCSQWNQGKGGKTFVRVATLQQLEFFKGCHLFDQNLRYVKIKGVDRHIGVKKLLDLSGRELKNVRQQINRFLRNYPNAVIRRATPEDGNALLDLKQAWNESLGKKYAKIWDDRAYQQIIMNDQELQHIVLVAEIGEQVTGVITGGILPHGQAWAALLKRREGYHGLSEFLNVEFVREIHKVNPEVEMINLGIDIGVKGGLREFKDKFRPVLNSERYRLYGFH